MSAILPAWIGLSELLFFGLLVIVFIFFLRDFKLTSVRSWVMLLGLLGLGALLVSQVRRRKMLLQTFEAREKKLKELEAEYKRLLDEAKITRAAYDEALGELQRAKVEEGMAILKADETLEEKTRAIENDFQNATPEESVALIKKALGA